MAVCLFPHPFRVFRWAGSGLLAAGLTSAVSVSALAQVSPTIIDEAPEEDPEPAPVAPATPDIIQIEPAEIEDDADPLPPGIIRVNPVSSSDFSIAYANQLTEEATAAISTQQYDMAVDKLNEARELYNQLSIYYQDLAEMFFGVDTRQNRDNRDKAIEAAQSRDRATYQLALIHRAQDKPEEAVPLLIEVLRSQQPTRDLGQQAYQQLFELGFVEAPYER